MIVSLLVQLIPVALAGLVATFVKRYFIMTSGYKKTNMPFLPEFNLLTGSKNIIFDPFKVLALKLHEWHEKLGDTFGCFFGGNMVLVSRDVDLIYKLCVEDFLTFRNRPYINSLSEEFRASLLEAHDQNWVTSRRAVGSVLKATKLKIDNVETDIDSALSRLFTSVDARLKALKLAGKEPVFDIYQINKNFFMQTILKIIYNADDLVDFDRDQNDVVEEMHKFVHVNYEAIARCCYLIPPLNYLVRPMLKFFDHGKYLGLLTDRLKRIIVETENKGQVRDANKLRTIHSLINSYRKGELTEKQLIGNSIYLMMAGFATSIDSMAALMWELAWNQEVQDKLRADLLQYGENSKYLEQCVNETLRLYPGALTGREIGEHLNYNNIRLIKGSNLIVSLYSIHRDKKHWGQNADDWIPERFNPSEVKKHHPAQFIPFGIGPRNCVGYHLARLEINKFAAQFLLRYKVETCHSTQMKLQITPLGALPWALPIEGPVYLKFTPVMDS